MFPHETQSTIVPEDDSEIHIPPPQSPALFPASVQWVNVGEEELKEEKIQ